jgi:hypothetical protein
VAAVGKEVRLAAALRAARRRGRGARRRRRGGDAAAVRWAPPHLVTPADARALWHLPLHVISQELVASAVERDGRALGGAPWGLRTHGACTAAVTAPRHPVAALRHVPKALLVRVTAAHWAHADAGAAAHRTYAREFQGPRIDLFDDC